MSDFIGKTSIKVHIWMLNCDFEIKFKIEGFSFRCYFFPNIYSNSPKILVVGGTKKNILFRRLAGLLNIDRIAGELGIESAQEAILRRVDQLVRRENAIISQKKCNIGVLTRKNKLLREELEGKELHMDMLRKKVAQLEEKGIMFLNHNYEQPRFFEPRLI